MTAINFFSGTDDAMGFGRMGHYWIKALADLGVTIHNNSIEGPYCETAVWSVSANHVRGWYTRQRRRHLLTMWEATHLPAGLHENIHEFETVFVPSRQNVEIFSRVHPNVVLAPLGIDSERFAYKERKPFDLDGKFNVYIPGQGIRKGTDLATSVFRRAFPQHKHFDPQPHAILKALIREEWKDERFEHVNGVISPESEQTLMDYSHVSLCLARGEGWGFFPMQTISCGIPTILSDAHGHHEFAEYGLPVPCGESSASRYLYGDPGSWWEPSQDEAIDLLRDVYENYDKHQRLAKENALALHADFPWSRPAKIMMDHLGWDSEVLAEPGEWQETTRRLFLLRVSRYVDPYIGGTMYEFDRNHDYRVPADVRRVIDDAGYLDQSCQEDQTGCLGLLEGESYGVQGA